MFKGSGREAEVGAVNMEEGPAAGAEVVVARSSLCIRISAREGGCGEMSEGWGWGETER